MAKCIPAVLEWARVDGSTIHVSAFPALSDVVRRSAECPVCGAPVVIRLGSKVRHHVAHRPGFTCPVSAPEGALHFNTKLHLARELALTHRIDIVQRCAHGAQKKRYVTFTDLGECERGRTRAWGPRWDHVEVEALVGEFVADILLLRNGKPAAVVEVLSRTRLIQ